MSKKNNEIMSSIISMMVSDAMAATMGVLVIIISFLLLDVREEYQQKLLELDTVKAEQDGITSDKSDMVTIILKDEIYMIETKNNSITHDNIQGFESALRSLPKEQTEMFAIYAEGKTPFQSVIDITDVLNSNFPETNISIGAINK